MRPHPYVVVALPPARHVARRIALTFTLAAALIAATIAMRHHDIAGLAPARIWAAKAAWSACADVVIAGDSRVYRGVSPAELARVLPNRRILNFGFSGAGYDAAYLRAIGRVLDPRAINPTILLGISPHSLTPRAAAENDYLAQRKSLRDRWRLSPQLDELAGIFPPLDADEIRTPWKHYHEEFFPDGWVASSRRPENPATAIAAYRARFDGNPVAPQQIDALLAAVADWTRRGVRVHAFRPPTCTAMLNLEACFSGFDEPAFIARFESAGGVWLAVSQTAYHTYDGSHLRADAAMHFSHDLARRMASRAAPWSAAATP